MLPTLSRRANLGRGRLAELAPGLDWVFDELFPLTSRGAWIAWTPVADLFESDDEFVLDMELPGFREKEIEVAVERGILSVSGQRTAEADEDEKRTYHVRERAYERFSRSFTLPASVDAEQVRAEFKNGILRVTLPKAREAKPRRIAVKAS
ncbi:MAG: Hsp20/alpha crystallin family protein [Gemmatimonadota bacterium]